MNAFFDSQFKYCPFIWMCHSRTNKRKIDRLQERCLRIIYNDKQSSFKELLEKDSSVSIHERNVQILATAMNKVSNNFSPPHMNESFKVRNEHPYNLRQNICAYMCICRCVSICMCVSICVYVCMCMYVYTYILYICVCIIWIILIIIIF